MLHLRAPRRAEPINNGCLAASLAARIANPESAFVSLRADRRHIANEIWACGNRSPHLSCSRSSNDRSHAFFFYAHVLQTISLSPLVTRIRVSQTSNNPCTSSSDNPRIPLYAAEFYSTGLGRRTMSLTMMTRTSAGMPRVGEERGRKTSPGIIGRICGH